MPNKFIKKAISKVRSLRRTLGVSKKTGKIDTSKVRAAAKKSGVTGKRAVTISKTRKKK
jgi:hypothetical protein